MLDFRRVDHPEHSMLRITNCWSFLAFRVGIIEHNLVTVGQP